MSLNLEGYHDMIGKVIHGEKISLRSLHVITVDDAYIRTLHRQYLHKNSSTDVITFHWDEEGEREGEIYICLDQAKLNAEEYGVTLEKEIARLIIHGLLHLNGYDDKDDAGKQQMRQLEDKYLQRYGRL